LVIDMAQPQGQLAKSLLEPGSDFEPEFIKAQLGKKKSAPEGETFPGPDGAEFYDTTAWSLPFAYDLHAWWCESAPPRRIVGSSAEIIRFFDEKAHSSVGYAIPYSDEEDALAVSESLNQGLKGMVTGKGMTVGSQQFPAGTFLFLAARNEEAFEDRLRPILKRHGSVWIPLESSYPESGRQGPGSESVIALRKPKIGVVFGNGPNMAQVGSIWYLMEQVWHLPFVPLSTGALGGDLSGYTCLVVPAGSGVTLTPKLREWINSGGCIVALGGLNWAVGPTNLVDPQSVPGDHQELPGSMFKAQLDPRSFLSFGYLAPSSGPIEIAVPVEGSSFFKARKEGGSVIKFADDEKLTKLLSGWSWPDETEKTLAGSVWLQDVPVGRGHAILFTYDPTSRAMWPGLHKLLLNAILIGGS
jgi:hypothetical protein